MLKKFGLIVLAVSAVLYVAGCILLRLGQTRFIFYPDPVLRTTPQNYGLDYQDVWIEIDREKVHGWWIPASEKTAPVLLYFHGNASNNGDVTDIAAMFHQIGLSVLLIDYRGYGKSSPTFPSEKSVYQDALAAWNYLTTVRQIEPAKIFVYGHSLGGAIAIELAIKHPEMAGLVVEGTFTSIKEVASQDKIFRIFPLGWILTQHFDSISKIQSLQVPVLIMHGTADEVIPVTMADELFAMAPEPKELLIIPQAMHNNVHQVGGRQYLEHLQQFIQSNLTN
ncbi:alpha/beta hydrolase [Pleurocapsa sp. PCC 7319]|uniref:alpha/beta hydrolase n=1 Tax=Pleurocapsa sp. PCC 7319 TaxID=118161 RepID=UPI00034CBC37|nr:alpha/beta hydrolase [Pleurocapsa sp. PCC 7319]